MIGISDWTRLSVSLVGILKENAVACGRVWLVVEFYTQICAIGLGWEYNCATARVVFSVAQGNASTDIFIFNVWIERG